MQFKVGDRVRTYSVMACNVGTISSISGNRLWIEYLSGPDGDTITKLGPFHAKQCRKLEPKVKKERKRIWVPKNVNELPFSKVETLGEYLYRKPDKSVIENYIEFQEVLPCSKK